MVLIKGQGSTLVHGVGSVQVAKSVEQALLYTTTGTCDLSKVCQQLLLQEIAVSAASDISDSHSRV